VLQEFMVGVTRAFLTNKKVSGGAVSLRRCQRNDCFANHLLDQRRRGYDRTALVSLCVLLKAYQTELLTSSFECMVKTRLCKKKNLILVHLIWYSYWVWSTDFLISWQCLSLWRNFSIFYGSRRIFAVFKAVRPLSLFWNGRSIGTGY